MRRIFVEETWSSERSLADFRSSIMTHTIQTASRQKDRQTQAYRRTPISQRWAWRYIEHKLWACDLRICWQYYWLFCKHRAESDPQRYPHKYCIHIFLSTSTSYKPVHMHICTIHTYINTWFNIGLCIIYNKKIWLWLCTLITKCM